MMKEAQLEVSTTTTTRTTRTTMRSTSKRQELHKTTTTAATTTTATLSTTTILQRSKGYNKGYGKQRLNNYFNKGASKKGQQLPVNNIAHNSHFYDDSQDWYNQEWYPEVDYPQYQAQEPAQQVPQQQPALGPLTSGSLYEVGDVINIGRKSPRHLKDFWAVIIDTGAAVNVCPITYCEHILITLMAERPTRANGPIGPSSTTPMDTDDNAGDQSMEENGDNGDIPMRCPQSVASSSTSSTTSGSIIKKIVTIIGVHTVQRVVLFNRDTQGSHDSGNNSDNPGGYLHSGSRGLFHKGLPLVDMVDIETTRGVQEDRQDPETRGDNGQ
eukprot:2465061-Amphidinium_carterae.3